MRCLIVAVIAYLACASSASAVIIDFEGGFGVDASDPVTVDGFTFDYIPDTGAIAPDGALAGDVGNGTRKLLTLRDSAETETTLVEEMGTPFDFVSFDAANVFSSTPDNRLIEVTGMVSGGGMVQANFLTDMDAFVTYVLPANFVNLTKVTFRTSGPTTSSGEGFQLDNVNVSPIPAPSAAVGLFSLMLAVGSFRLVRARRRASA